MEMIESENNVNELLEENNRLRGTIEELSILNEIISSVSSVQSLEEIEKILIKKCLKYLSAEEGVIMLLNNENYDKPFHSILRTQNSIIDSSTFKLDDQIMGWIVKNKTTLVVNNLKDDARFSIGNSNELSLKSLLAVPMFIKRKMIGIIVLFNKRDGDFSEGDQRLLAICATQSAQVIENARLNQQEQLLIKMKEEMTLASQIQNNLLPKDLLNVNEFYVIGKTISAQEVGGDFYDFVPLSDNIISIWLGDVTGKGIPASLLMANIQGFLRSRSVIDKDCNTCISAANEFMIKNCDNGKFATLFYSILNTTTSQMDFILAGHNNILHFKSNGKVEIYSSSDIPLGIYSDYNFEIKNIVIEPNDFILVYSDGIIEAIDNNENLFGEERLIETVKKYKNSHPADLIESIYNQASIFSEDQSQFDDQTLLIIGRN